MKQGINLSGVLAGNLILNFENGILVERGNISAPGSGGGVNPDVWEGDINMLALDEFPGGYYNYKGKKTGLLINQGDTVTFYVSGDYLQTTYYPDSNILDGCYGAWDNSYSANWSSETPWGAYNIYASCVVPNTNEVHNPFLRWTWDTFPDYSPSHTYTIPMYIRTTYIPINELIILVEPYYGNDTVNGDYTVHIRAEITRV